MDKTIFLAWEHAFPREKALFEAWERQIPKMTDLGTAFSCVPTHVNPLLHSYIFGHSQFMATPMS